MRYTNREADPLADALEAVVQGLGLSLIELTLSRSRGRGSPGAAGRVQVRAVIDKAAPVGVDDCSRAHRALLPRLELAFPGEDLYVEVSSPGVGRLIKDGSELVHYIGRKIRCFRTDVSDWTAGILKAADENHLVLETKEGTMDLKYESIAKAKLDSQEV
ncbi:ribosome maturation factor RimP [Spirochaetia bacterium]|nr:ribosome maturation factor RimP [Spirochaetia bacterium]